MPKCARCSMQSGRRKSKRQKEIERNIKISFHKFPVNETRKLSWIKSMDLDENKINKMSVLCSLHFAESDFDRTSLSSIRLRDNTIPSIITPVIESEASLDIIDEKPIQIESETVRSTECIASTLQVGTDSIKIEDIIEKDVVHEMPKQIAPGALHSTEFTASTSQIWTFLRPCSQINTDIIESFIHILHAMQREISLHPSANDLTVSIPKIVTERAANFKSILHADNQELTLQTSLCTATVLLKKMKEENSTKLKDL